MMATVLRHRPDLEARSNGLTALFYAILAGDEGVVRLLLEAGAEATARTLCVPGTGESVVHMAVGSWRHAMLPLLIALGADVNVRGTNPAGQTALHITAEQGNEEALRALIEAGVDVFAKYADGRTALDVAAKEGRVGTASMLLDRGVNVAGYEDGRTSPMYLAAVHNREELVRFLLGRCGSAMSEEERIHVVNGAAGAGRLEILKLLHAKGFPVIGRDERGDSGLTLAAYFGHKDAAVYLLRQGADIQGRDVQVAGWSRNPGVLELLQEAERQRAAVPDAELFPGWKDSPERFDPSSELSRQAEFFWTPAFSVKATRWIHVNQAPAGSFRCLVCRDLDFRRGMPADAEVAYFIAVELMGTAASGGCRGCRFLSDCLAQARRAYGEGEWGYDSMTHITLHSMALGAPLLLHGRGGDHTSWPSRRVEIYVEEGTYYSMSYRRRPLVSRLSQAGQPNVQNWRASSSVTASQITVTVRTKRARYQQE
jgi:ankyrin repeat protein